MSDKNTEEQEISEQELEEEELLRKADEVKERQLELTPDGSFTTKREIEDFALEDIDDPDRKHEIYYSGIQKLLMKELPSGEEYSELREKVYEEKKIFLTRGHKKDSQGIRGADSRMAYLTDMKEAMNIITRWILDRGTAYELFQKFREKNQELGYYSDGAFEEE